MLNIQYNSPKSCKPKVITYKLGYEEIQVQSN